MSVQYIIGIDGGGTKTYGRITELNTYKHFEAKGGSSSLSNDFELATKTITELLQQLMSKAQCQPEQVSVVIGVAGGGVASQAHRLELELPFPFAALEICNDAKTSLIGANSGQPVTVVALGTGSVGARLDLDNSEHYYGGWGFPVGDDGGGAKLGFSAIQTLITELDAHGKPVSEISKVLFTKVGGNNGALASWLSEVTPAIYGTLCRTVFSLVSSCNTAKCLIQQHAKHCETLILDSRKDSNSPVVLLGGLAPVTLPFLSNDVADYCQLALGTALDGACLLAEKNINKSSSKLTNKAVVKSKELQADPALLQQLNNMVSEERHPDTMQIDLMNSKEILLQINNEDKKVPLAVELCIEPMALAVDGIVDAFNKGGRLVYIGAGTSGRLGILDAVECPPTFSVTSEQVVGIIAGGNKAIYKAVEGAEDSSVQGKEDLENIKFDENDILVGIAASGRTPYVIGALDYANQLGAKTVCVTCNPDSEMSKHSDITICPIVGPEVLTGSTRMKSGTAQKLVLNMLSTASMIRTGKSYENLMVDVSASNKKLYMRAIRIVMQATKCNSEVAEHALIITNFKVKLAILHILTGVEPKLGQHTLVKNGGFLRSAVASLNS